jgi:hypothetical protein
LKCEDWRSRDILWDQTRYALEFFQNNVPFAQMKSADGLTDNPKDYMLAENGATYLVYLPEVKETKLNLIGTKAKFAVKWFNPRTGGKLQKGSVKYIRGGAKVSIGFPPSKEKDWVALITNTKLQKSTTGSAKPVVLSALEDFTIAKDAEALYYVDNKNKALAINAGAKDQRAKFAAAYTVFKGESGVYKGMFQSMTENDGESVYEIRVNGNTVGTYTNPETKKDFERVDLKVDAFYLAKNDIIEVLSKAVTNGKIPENDETAWSRGRWGGLILMPGKGLQLRSKLEKAKAFTAKNGVIEVEAEDFQFSSKNGTEREWFVRSKNEKLSFENLEKHYDTASGNAYVEALPDTRVTHADPLIKGENFFPLPGFGGVVSYKVKITSPGKYYVWTKAYSSGPEDNGLHVGVNGTWPESGARIQLCAGKNKWTWTSAQRVPKNHCGTPNSIYLEFKNRGTYIVSFSMREDGFEFDKFILTKNKNYQPK